MQSAARSQLTDCPPHGAVRVPEHSEASVGSVRFSVRSVQNPKEEKSYVDSVFAGSVWSPSGSGWTHDVNAQSVAILS